MRARHLVIAILLAVGLVGLAEAQAPSRYPDQTTTGRFRDQDTLPGSFRFYQQQPGGAAGLWGLGPGQATPKRASFRMDAHEGVANYTPRRLCTDCHDGLQRDLHQVRMGIRCVQCHRTQPIAGVFHYYSALNPIRRHAYVCAKCHEGATPSFATYVIHEPSPITLEAREDFPLLFYATWFMIILAGGVFAFFLPVAVLWILREIVGKLFRRGRSHA